MKFDPQSLAITVQFILAIGMALMVLIVSHLFGQRGRPNKLKDSPYECGIATEVEPIGPFSVKFYRIALLFILFEISLSLLIPWAMSFKNALSIGLKTFYPAFIFIGFLSLALFYIIKRGGLRWEE